MNETSLPKTIYSMLKEDVDKGINYTGLNWAFHLWCYSGEDKYDKDREKNS